MKRRTRDLEMMNRRFRGQPREKLLRVARQPDFLQTAVVVHRLHVGQPPQERRAAVDPDAHRIGP